MLALWATLALAAPPDRAPAEFELASGDVDNVVVSGDGRLIGAVANDTFHLLDMDDWTVETSAPCAVTAVALEYFATDIHYAWVGCDESEVRLLLWEDGDFSQVTVDGDPVVYDIGDPRVLGIWAWEEGGLIYVLSEGEDDNLYLHTIVADTGAVDSGSGFPILMPRTGYVEGLRADTRLIVFHGSSNVSQLTLGSSSVLPNIQNYPYSVTDAALSIRDGAYVVGGTSAAEYLPTNFVYQLVIAGLDSPDAIGASTLADDEWLVVDDASGVAVYTLSGGVLESSDPVHTFDPGVGLVDIAVARWGYGFAGTENGRLMVLTANPWVYDISVSPSDAAEGDTVTLSFTSDTAGNYEVYVGGDAAGTGTSVATGSVTADTPETVEITVDESFQEGETPIYALVQDSASLIGHNTAKVTVDAPPPAPEAQVRAGDSALTVSFDGLTVEDLDHYTIYITTTAFTADDWPTGGPDFDGTDAITAPITVDADPGEAVSERITPLTNGQLYYIAVRATDAGGKEGPMSDVVQGTPSPLESASEKAGDAGGAPSCGCSTTSPSGLGLVGLAGLLLLVRRRRGTVLAGLLAVLAPLSAAHAQDPDRGDVTAAWSNIEFRYGGFSYADANSPIIDVYGKTGHGFFQFEIGPQIYRIAEVDLGVGFYRDSTFTRDDTGTLSTEGTALVQWPLLLDLTLRAHIWDEQILVPYGRIGFDYILWRERVDDGSGTSAFTSGAKAGWHFGFGGQLLLDVFAPGRASLLEASTGINDTWLVVEWRRRYVEPGKFLFLDNSDGLDFSGDWLTFGLKLDW